MHLPSQFALSVHKKNQINPGIPFVLADVKRVEKVYATFGTSSSGERRHIPFRKSFYCRHGGTFHALTVANRTYSLT